MRNLSPHPSWEKEPHLAGHDTNTVIGSTVNATLQHTPRDARGTPMDIDEVLSHVVEHLLRYPVPKNISVTTAIFKKVSQLAHQTWTLRSRQKNNLPTASLHEELAENFTVEDTLPAKEGTPLGTSADLEYHLQRFSPLEQALLRHYTEWGTLSNATLVRPNGKPLSRVWRAQLLSRLPLPEDARRTIHQGHSKKFNVTYTVPAKPVPTPPP